MSRSSSQSQFLLKFIRGVVRHGGAEANAIARCNDFNGYRVLHTPFPSKGQIFHQSILSELEPVGKMSSGRGKGSPERKLLVPQPTSIMFEMHRFFRVLPVSRDGRKAIPRADFPCISFVPGGTWSARRTRTHQ